MRVARLLKPILLFSILALFGTSVCFGQTKDGQMKDKSSLTKAEIESGIKALVQPYVEGGVINSVAIGVIDGEIESVFGVGQISSENTNAPDGDTLFEIGSISKVFTGILLADAIQRGLVTADQAAAELLPDGVKMPVWPKKPDLKITLTQLATHTSGLPGLPDNLQITDLVNPYAKYETKDLHEFLNAYELERKPGTREEYSNLAFGLLGELISGKQKRTYDELLLERILKPLEMNDTSITLSSDQKKRLATPHNDALIPTSTWEVPALKGCGAIRSTTNDMMKFARAALAPEKLGKENPIGKAFELAWAEQRPSKFLKWGPMGFGWVINKSGTHWHNGGTGGFHTIMFVDQKNERALIVLCNTASFEVDTLGSEIMAMLNGKDVKPRKFRKTVKVSEELCAKLIGKYRLYEKVFIDVAYVEGSKTALTVQMTGQSPLNIFPASETNWFLKVVKAEVEFEIDESGKCSGLTLIQNGKQNAKKL